MDFNTALNRFKPRNCSVSISRYLSNTDNDYFYYLMLLKPIPKDTKYNRENQSRGIIR